MVTAPVYEIAMDGILIGGPDAEKLPAHETLSATLQDIGACRIRIGECSKSGSQARFEAASVELRDKIEDRMWAIHEENAELVTRAMRGGRRAEQDLRDRIGQRRDHAGARCSIPTTSRSPGTNPVQYRTKMLDWADRALPAFAGSVPRKGPSAWRSAPRSTSNGYLPVHNKIYSQPQRPGDVACNTANCRNRRIFNDAAGLAAAATSAPI